MAKEYELHVLAGNYNETEATIKQLAGILGVDELIADEGYDEGYWCIYLTVVDQEIQKIIDAIKEQQEQVHDCYEGSLNDDEALAQLDTITSISIGAFLHELGILTQEKLPKTGDLVIL